MGNRQSQGDELDHCSPRDRLTQKISTPSFHAIPSPTSHRPLSATLSKNDKIPCLPDTNPQARRQKLSVGAFPIQSLESLNQRPSSRKVFSQKSDPKVLQLTDSEKLCLQRSWNELIASHPSFIHEVWTAAIDRSPSIKATFIQYAKKRNRRPSSAADADGFEDHFDLGEVNESDEAQFRNLTQIIHNFFHQLLIIDQLDHGLMKAACQALGLRHRSYSQHGYQPVFFDIFIVCFLDRLELFSDEVQQSLPMERQSDTAVNEYWKVMTNASTADADSKQDAAKKKKVMFAWQKFMRMIVDMMRDGYLKSENPSMAEANSVSFVGPPIGSRTP